MSIKKQYLKSKPVCKVTFRITKDEVQNAQEVKLLGSFNNWNEGSEPMKKLKTGEFTATIELPIDENVEFRYLVNGSTWVNDPESEGFVPNAFGDVNSLISTASN